MRPSTILPALLGAWTLSSVMPPPAAAQPAGAPGADPWRCERPAQWLTRCAIEVAAPGGEWVITARVWLRRASTLAPLAGELVIRVDGQPCGRPAGVSLPAAATGRVNYTLQARCAVALTPGLRRVEGVANFRNPTTGSDIVELQIRRWTP